MKSIYKYPIEDGTIIDAPIEHILDVQIQNGELVAWATIKNRQPNRKILFKIFGTGWEFTDDFEFGTYLKTVQDGPWVWHIFAKEVDAVLTVVMPANSLAQPAQVYMS
jgi:hypothetical protein